MKKYFDNDFSFNYCPDCGGSVELGGLFSNMGMVVYGKNGRCRDCGKEWHVIREDTEEESEND